MVTKIITERCKCLVFKTSCLWMNESPLEIWFGDCTVLDIKQISLTPELNVNQKEMSCPKWLHFFHFLVNCVDCSMNSIRNGKTKCNSTVVLYYNTIAMLYTPGWWTNQPQVSGPLWLFGLIGKLWLQRIQKCHPKGHFL